MKKITIKDVANDANVSIATVSKVINKKGYVKDSTLDKVIHSINKLGYSVNANARSLKLSKSNKIAVLISDISNPYLMSIAKDVEEMIRSLNAHMMLLSHNDDPVIERSSLKIIIEQQVDALVIIPTGANADIIQSMIDFNTPVIAIDREVDGVNTDLIVDDNYYGSYESIKYLHELGHRRIGTIDGHKKNSIGRDRHRGVVEAFKNLDMEINESLIYECEFKEDLAYRSTIELMLNPEPPTAIYSSNNTMTIGVLKALRDKDINIPSDVSLIAFGDSKQWELVEPKLTLMTQPMKRIGIEASVMLKNRLIIDEKFDVQSKIMRPELIEGESCQYLKKGE